MRLSLKGHPPSDALERTTRARVLHIMEEPIEVSSYDRHLWGNVFHLERPNLEKLSLQKVERLRCMPRYRAEYHSHSTFVVEDGSSLCGIEAQLQVF